MRLFLSGGGGAKKSIVLDKKFASVIDKSKPLLYIPIAIDKAAHPYPECYKWISSVFNSLGIKSIILWTEQDIDKNEYIEVDKFSGIYIGGGNTFYLMSALRNSRFIDYLKNAIELDIPVYGGSAGAIILGKDIRTSSDEDESSLKDFAGLDLIHGYNIFCHYNKHPDWAKDSSKDLKTRSIALSEDSGLFVNEDKIEVIGPGSAYLPDKKLFIKPGQEIKFSASSSPAT